MKITAQPKRLLDYLIIFLTASAFVSCTTERISYFKDVPDSTHGQVKYVDLPTFTPPVVHPDDILNIIVQTLDPQANSILNQGNLPVQSGVTSVNPNAPVTNNQNTVSGYLVNKDGFIFMPYIGNVQVNGYTTTAVHDTILAKISFYFKNPVVNVRFANFKVTVLGEVTHAATFSIPNEKPTVLDAIGLAGDITIYGKRNNVLIMRDNNGKKELTRLNLDSSSFINSPYFYLKPNDVIYVEASATRVARANQFRNRDIAILSSGLSLLTVVVARLLR